MSQPQKPSFIRQHWKLVGGLLATVGTIIGIVSGVIAIYDRVTAGTSVSEAIRIDYRYSGDIPDGVVRNFDPSKRIDYYIDHRQITYSQPQLDIDIVSQAEDEQVKVAPYLMVEITDTEPMPENVDYIKLFYMSTLAQGDRTTDWFNAILTPEREGPFPALQLEDYERWGTLTMGAPSPGDTMTGASSASPADQYVNTFTDSNLEPGERKTLHLTCEMLPGYFYHYRVGVKYSYQGDESVKWADREFVTGMPTEGEVWLYRFADDGGYTAPLTGVEDWTEGFFENYHQLNEDDLERQVQMQQMTIRTSRSFPSPG